LRRTAEPGVGFVTLVMRQHSTKVIKYLISSVMYVLISMKPVPKIVVGLNGEVNSYEVFSIFGINLLLNFNPLPPSGQSESC
jgi:hypothetical protein